MHGPEDANACCFFLASWLTTMSLDFDYIYGTAQFKPHMCRHTHVLACLTHAKLWKLVCMHCCTWDSEYMQHMRNTCHNFVFALPHCTCGVTTVVVGNKIQPRMLQLIGFFICCNEHRLKVLFKRRSLTKYARVSSCC